jgi:hypothetical protein
MGTYPSFAFTPDDGAILIWGRAGRIWRVPLVVNQYGERVLEQKDTEEDVVKEVKFRASVEIRIAETRRLRDYVNVPFLLFVRDMLTI